MSDDRLFERDARAWLELGPTDAPDRVVENALLTIESTAQERDLRIPWRDFRMTTVARIAMAAAIGALAIGGVLLVLRGPLAHVGSPSSAPTLAIPARPTGWIVFSASGRPTLPSVGSEAGNVATQIWLVKADGSGLHELAPGIPAEGKGTFSISPDGKKVAFSSVSCGRLPCASSQIWEAPIDGGDPTLLSTDCFATAGAIPCSEADPAYSPDGTKLAFSRAVGSTTDASGTNVIGIRDLHSGHVTFIETTRSLINGQLDTASSHPAWSPDGTQIAFQQFIRNWGGGPAASASFDESRIEVVGIDGTGLHELPVPGSSSNAGRPSWSPNASILFSTAVDWFGSPAGEGAPFTVRSDGTDLTSLCAVGRPGACLDYPTLLSWTPDGTGILFWGRGSWGLMDLGGARGAYINADALSYSNVPAYGSVALLQP